MNIFVVNYPKVVFYEKNLQVLKYWLWKTTKLKISIENHIFRTFIDQFYKNFGFLKAIGFLMFEIKFLGFNKYD